MRVLIRNFEFDLIDVMLSLPEYLFFAVLSPGFTLRTTWSGGSLAVLASWLLCDLFSIWEVLWIFQAPALDFLVR